MNRAYVWLLIFSLFEPHPEFSYHFSHEKLSPTSQINPAPAEKPYVVEWMGCRIEPIPHADPYQIRNTDQHGHSRCYSLSLEQERRADKLSFGNPKIKAVIAMQLAGFIPPDKAFELMRELQMQAFQIPDAGAKTFVATLGDPAVVSPADRQQLDQAVKKVIEAEIKTKKALRVGKMTPLLTAQTRDTDLAARAAQAYRLLAEAAVAYSKKHSGSEAAKAIRKGGWYAVRTDGDDGRALARVIFLTAIPGGLALAMNVKEGKHLIGSSGRFKAEEALREAPFGSHYVALELVESAIPVLKMQEGMKFLGAWIAHETQVLQERRYVEPSAEDLKILNEGYRKIVLAGKKKVSAYARLNAADRKFIDGVTSSSAAAREVLAAYFLNEIPAPSAKNTLMDDLGFPIAQVQNWCRVVAGEVPLSRGTLAQKAFPADLLVACSL